MLRAVIAEERLYIFHAADGNNIPDKYEYPQYALHKVEHERARDPLAQKVHHPRWQYDEEHQCDRQRKEEGGGHQKVPRGFFAELFIDPRLELSRLFAVFFRRVFFEYVCRLHKRPHSVYERAHKDHDPAKERDLCGSRLLALFLCPEVKLAGRQAHRDGGPVRALHHHAFHYRLSAY